MKRWIILALYLIAPLCGQSLLNPYRFGAAVTTYSAITSTTTGTPRSDFTGRLGFRFTANADMTVTHVGRWVVSGNANAHTVGIYNSGGTLLGSASVATSGQPAAAFAYASLGTTVALTSGSTYYCMSLEANGGDQWLNDVGTTPTTTADITVVGAYYDAPPFTPNTAGASYVPPNFKYTKP